MALPVHLFHYHLVTSKVRLLEARYLGKLGFELIGRYGWRGESSHWFEAGTSWEELDKAGFRLRLVEVGRGAVNVVLQPGHWDVPRVDHLGIALEEEDYENVLVPAIEAAIAEHGKVRLVYVLGHEFDEYEGEAIWEDVKLGARHPASFERMAIVTDAKWAGPAIKVFSVLWPGQARAFRLADLESAKRWAAEGSTGG